MHTRIIALTRRQPPGDKKHLMEVEQQVALGRQQAADMLRKRQELYLERELLERKDVNELTAEANRWRAMRRRVAERRAGDRDLARVGAQR